MASQPKIMIYTVDIGDGKVADIEGPEGATAEQLRSAYQEHAPVDDGGSRITSQGLEVDINGATVDPNLPEMQPEADGGLVSDALTGLGRGGRDVMNAVGSAADLITLPITALMKLGGANIESYRGMTDKLANDIGLPTSDTGVQKLISALNEGAGVGLATAGVGGALAGAGGITGSIGETLAATPVADMVSNAVGAGGANIAEQNGAGPIGQTFAGMAGGAAGAGAALGLPAAARRVAHSTESNDLLKAFERQQVTPMADQVGGVGSRMASGVSRMTLGGIPLAEAAEKSITTARSARDRIAARIGRITDDTGAGQAAQKGAKSFISSTLERAGRLYDAIPISSGKLSSLSSTRAALSDMTEGMKSNPELSAMVAENPRLKGYLDALSPKDVLVDQTLPGGGKAQPLAAKKGGELSWEDLKRFRSIIGEIAGQPTLADDTSQASMRKLYAALSEDMRTTAAADGPASLAKFERANTFFRARQSRIDNTLSAVLGNDFAKSPEDAYKLIERWSRDGGDSARLAQTLRSMPSDEASTVRATVLSRLGNVPAGRQDLSGNVYSPADFATQWNKLDDRAKAVLFPGKEYRSDLSDIVKIADAMKRSTEFANTSRTALAGNGIGLATMALAGSPLSAGGIAASQFGIGKLLASPRFARWLASSPKKPPGPATLAHINRLTAIATAEPVIANEVLRLQERLASAFTNSPQRIAAEEPGNGTGEPPANGEQ